MSDVIKATAASSKSGQFVTVNVNGTVTTVNVCRDQSVSSGDVVLVTRIGSEWWVIGRAYTSAPNNNQPPPAPPPAPPVIGRLVVAPVETRTYRGGWNSTGNDSVYQGEYGGSGNKTGCVFYGSGPRSLHGATVTSASIQVRRLSGGTYAAQTATMRLMVEAFRPAGGPTLGLSTTGPSLAVGATNGAFPVPASWAQSFVDNTAGGLAFFTGSGSPYIRFAGRGDWSAAFALTINWRRN